MKPGVILVNTARGALADEAALLAALKSGHIRHAGLDVFHTEPLKADHPLAKLPNVTLTSHAAFRTLEASMTLLRRAIDIVKSIRARDDAPRTATIDLCRVFIRGTRPHRGHPARIDLPPIPVTIRIKTGRTRETGAICLQKSAHARRRRLRCSASTRTRACSPAGRA